MSKLNIDQLKHYSENGYVFPDFKLSKDLVTRLQTGIESAIDRLGDQFKPEDIPNPHFLDFSSDGVNNPFLEVAHHPDILDMVEQVLGPNLILWIARVFCKPSLTGREVPWHQDGEYWPMRPLETCTVWIALDEVTTENGCMRFIPGSHESGLYKHHMSDRKDLVLNLELDGDQFDESGAVNVELEPGAISMHHVKIIHGSHANTSPKRRAALVLRYMPASSHYDRSLVDHGRFKSPFNLTEQPLMLMRGTDVSGQNDLISNHEYWKERYSEK